MFVNHTLSLPYHPPLEFRILVHNLGKNELLFEVQVQNISLSIAAVEKITLVLPEICAGTETDTFNLTGEDDGTFEETTILKPMERRRYFCQFQLKNELLKRPGLGILDILWRRSIGEMPIIQTIKLEKEVLRYGNISVSVKSMPDTVLLEEPFHMTCKVTNFSNLKMKLFLQLFHTDSIRWHLPGGKYLGMLSPRKSLRFTVNLLFIKHGLQHVSGIQITDKFTKKTYICEDVVTVRVEPTFDRMHNLDFSIRIKQKTIAFYSEQTSPTRNLSKGYCRVLPLTL